MVRRMLAVLALCAATVVWYNAGAKPLEGTSFTWVNGVEFDTMLIANEDADSLAYEPGSLTPTERTSGANYHRNRWRMRRFTVQVSGDTCWARFYIPTRLGTDSVTVTLLADEWYNFDGAWLGAGTDSVRIMNTNPDDAGSTVGAAGGVTWYGARNY